jgi:hypothetical protein
MADPVNNIIEVVDRSTKAQDNNLFQFKNSTTLKKLVKVFVDELQLVESEVIKLLTLRTIEDATGQQLDDLGAVLKISRMGQTDEQYRATIKIRYLRDATEGTTEDVLKLLRLFTGDIGITMYKGDRYFVDLDLFAGCREDPITIAQLSKFFPVVTNLRVTAKTGVSFGFLNDSTAEGFSTIHDAEIGGRWVSLIGVTEP